MAVEASLVTVSLKSYSSTLLPLPGVGFDENTHFTPRMTYKGLKLTSIYVCNWSLKVKILDEYTR